MAFASKSHIDPKSEVRLLSDITRELTDDDFQKLKVAVQSEIPPATLEKCTIFSDIWRELKKRAKIEYGNYDYLVERFRINEMHALAAYIEKTQKQMLKATAQTQMRQYATTGQTQIRQDKTLRDVYLDLVKDGDVIERWEMVGHALDVTKNAIVSIKCDVRTTENQCYEVLQKWESQKSKEATVENLVKALRELDLKTAADDIETKYLEDTRSVKTDGI